jgi:hypothetical protein
MMDPVTLIVIVVLVILLVWLITKAGLPEPWRTIVIAVLAIAILFAILRLLGIW